MKEAVSKGAAVTAKNVDLSNCDREQIQFAAATLTHGFLLVLQEPELTVIQAGRNASDILGAPMDGILSQPVDNWLDAATANSLRETIARIQADGPPLHVGRPTIGARPFHFFVHRCSGSLIVEFEVAESQVGTPSAGLEHSTFSAVHATISKLQQARTVREFLNLAVTQIREFTGFERVMAYEFLPDGSGAVRAESAAPEWETFLGLHYPASDVPAPARRLFQMTWLRHQPDIGYVPVPIVPERNPVTGQPLDLSYALLRSVSTMYSQYLKNMGTQSSMVMTLLKNGELWGLIACHHHSAPRHVPFEIRAACEFLAHMVSLLLSAKGDQEDLEYRVKLQTAHAHMVGELALNSDLAAVMLDRRPGLLDFIEARGAAAVVRGAPTLIGATPEEEQVQRLVEWLSQQDQDIFHTDRLSQVYPAAAAYCSIASGLLAIRIASTQSDYLLWFRPEFQQTVKWAGDPQKPVALSADGQRLLPRTSFAIWRETVRYRSQPWKAVELGAARQLREALLEIAARRVGQLNVLYQDLQQTNVELDAFAYIASHDLKEPLRGIHNYTQFLLEDVGETLPAEAVDKLRTVVRLTRRMDALLDSLLHYSRLGRRGIQLEACDLNSLVDEVLDTLTPRIQEEGAEIRVLRPLPVVMADRSRLSEVFMNLIANAIKYNDRGHKLVEIGCTEAGGERAFFVRDNGIGIAREHLDVIFGIFRRLHSQDRYGGGTGAGLTIVRKIVERHEGRVWVESAPGTGSTFRFTLGIK